MARREKGWGREEAFPALRPWHSIVGAKRWGRHNRIGVSEVRAKWKIERSDALIAIGKGKPCLISQRGGANFSPPWEIEIERRLLLKSMGSIGEKFVSEQLLNGRKGELGLSPYLHEGE